MTHRFIEMLTQGLRALFLAQASITTLVPSQVVFGVTIPGCFCDNPKQAFRPPFIVVSSDDLNPVETLDGTLSETISIDAVARSEQDAKAISTAIRAYIEPFVGAAMAGTVTDTIKGVFWQDQTYDYDYVPDGTDSKFHKITTKYLVYYS